MTCVCGFLLAIRCLAPEYYTHGIVDEKTDVFAFGVFLLELMTGRKPVDGTHRSLLSWVTKTSPFIYLQQHRYNR